MALVLNRNRVGVENTSTTVGIPDNPLARLMYYLNCMCTVLSLDEPGLNRLTNYDVFFLLSDEDKVLLLLLCAKLNPVALTGKCLLLNENVRSTAGRDNEFYNINAETMTFAASESVFVGEKRVAVKKVMVYNSSWLYRNYIQPMKFFLNDDDDAEPTHINTTPETTGYYQQALTYYQTPTQQQYNQPAIAYNRPTANQYHQQPSYTRPSYQRQDSESCCCTIL